MARFLLVDDDHDIRKFGVAVLASAGHEAFSADGALSALDFLSHNHVDVLITDANMPRHTGFDLVKTLSNDTRFSHLSIAMLTGRRERKDIERALEAGVHDYIVKPLDPVLFLKRVTDLLEKRPPAERAQADFASLNLNLTAKASMAVEIVSLSELGLTLRSPTTFQEGTRIEIASDLFGMIGIEVPLMKVITSIEQETRVSFIGLDENTLTKIRAWVHSNTVKRAA